MLSDILIFCDFSCPSKSTLLRLVAFNGSDSNIQVDDDDEDEMEDEDSTQTEREDSWAPSGTCGAKCKRQVSAKSSSLLDDSTIFSHILNESNNHQCAKFLCVPIFIG